MASPSPGGVIFIGAVGFIALGWLGRRGPGCEQRSSERNT